MDIVQASTRGVHGAGASPPIDWIDSNTVKNAQYIVLNVFLEMNRVPPYDTAVMNLPLRIWNCVTAFQNRDYLRVAFDVLAFASLFSPLGRPGAIAVDVVSELVSVYKKMPNRNPDKLDCTILENALKVLGLSEAESQDQETLNIRYTELCGEWDKRIDGAKHSPLLLAKFQTLRAQVEEAYQTLQKRVV